VINIYYVIINCCNAVFGVRDIVDVIVVDSAAGWQLKMTFKVAYYIIRCIRARGGVSDDSFGVRMPRQMCPRPAHPPPVKSA